ncbi:FBD-associated F-box protein At4g10400-like [Arachis ipaensis]|uniref:FBD-associated F-box protein At4g10400-like n=1 Tax=Arachis ipaensis TaxID=130454 RepID=UPI000A2B3B5E|nr:FBD-associated F-box protein At4g10400-like [Arachis ipaensis]
MREKPKKRELGNRETLIAMDMISDLPDCILLHVLSFLPTKTAFLTTVLSRRWTNLCDDLQHLHFEQNQFRNRNTCSYCYQFDVYTVEWFIRKVLGPNLEELNLQLSFVCCSDRKVVIPNGVLSCTSLVTLRLNGGIRIPSPPSSSCRYHLPSLKTLQLYNVKTSVGNLEELLSHCTALETLVLDSVCRSQEEGQLSICFPSLKSLHFKSYFGDALSLLLVIDTPSLKRLYIQVVSGFREIRVRNLHNVEEARINISKQSIVLEFLVELCRIRILELGLLTVDCLPEVPPHRIPEFTCLQRLELTVKCFDTRSIMNMLQKCPMLKLLAIVFSFPKMDPHPSRKWELPAKIPTCLASHLQVIKIKRYYESRDDRDFFAYVLQHGLVLESLDLQVDDMRSKGFPEELSLLPRSSKACQINFCWI